MSEQAESTLATPIPEHFHRDARLNTHQQRRHRCVLGMLQGIEGSVLDYGCGWGDITYAISHTHPDVRGVDVDPERVAFARREYAPLPFSACRPDGLDFPDASFDVVVSVVVIPFVPDVGGYLAEARRVLRPGGHLLLVGRSVPLLTRIWRRLRHQGPDAGSHLKVRTPGQLKAVLREQGFTILKQSAFYDPPFSRRRNLVDVANSVVELLGDALGAVEPAPYPVFLARRNDG